MLFHSSTNTSTNTSSPTVATVAATVEITAKGFEPATLRIKVGAKVTWNNTDSVLHQIASNPYPANNGLPGLSSPGLESGQSYSYTFRQAGKFGYHDQQNPTQMLGVVDVAE
jgi:plastocyanin